ncbi:MAG: DUF883 family protein [Verrucomicrobia subdivision 3 bacterium]|nr:DUF883 family protein [Limisphaerales bacterium]
MNEQAAMEDDVTFGKLVKDFKVVVHDAESLCKATASDLGDKAREARARLAASLESAKANFQKLEDKAAAGARATDQVIRSHPYESLGIAFGVGVLIGLLVTRK